MAQRLRDAGFPASDAQVLGPNPRKGNLVARLRGTRRAPADLADRPSRRGRSAPRGMVGGPVHISRARRLFLRPRRAGHEIRRRDFRGRRLIRFRKEEYRPDRDIILMLTADEETGNSNGVEWLLRNHRDLIDAEFVAESRWRRRLHAQRQAGHDVGGRERKTLCRLSARGEQSRRAQLVARARQRDLSS